MKRLPFFCSSIPGKKTTIVKSIAKLCFQNTEVYSRSSEKFPHLIMGKERLLPFRLEHNQPLTLYHSALTKAPFNTQYLLYPNKKGRKIASPPHCCSRVNLLTLLLHQHFIIHLIRNLYLKYLYRNLNFSIKSTSQMKNFISRDLRCLFKKQYMLEEMGLKTKHIQLEYIFLQ